MTWSSYLVLSACGDRVQRLLAIPLAVEVLCAPCPASSRYRARHRPSGRFARDATVQSSHLSSVLQTAPNVPRLHFVKRSEALVGRSPTPLVATKNEQLKGPGGMGLPRSK